MNYRGQHPEVDDLENICAIAHHTDPTSGVCDQLNEEHLRQAKMKSKRIKKEKKLDKTLQDTFPASDPTAKY